MNKHRNIFVASRMKNIVERKAVIDVVHTLGHSPVFIEAEEMKKGKESKGLMDNMLNRSDCLIAVICDDTGMKDPNLDGFSPLIYEISQFKGQIIEGIKEGKVKKDEVRGIIFRQVDFKDRPVQNDKDETVIKLVTSDIKSNLMTVDFHDYDDLAASAHELITQLWGLNSLKPNFASHFLTISWAGINKNGILGKITSLLFTEYNLNVVQLSASNLDNNASINISASTWHNIITPDATEVKRAIKKILHPEGGQAINTTPVVNIIKNKKGQEPVFYFELRVLDVPGLLNALCKVLFDQNMDIKDIRQKPILEGHKNQSRIILTLTPIDDENIDATRSYLRLESRLRNLVGVRAIKSMIVSDGIKDKELNLS